VTPGKVVASADDVGEQQPDLEPELGGTPEPLLARLEHVGAPVAQRGSRHHGEGLQRGGRGPPGSVDAPFGEHRPERPRVGPDRGAEPAAEAIVTDGRVLRWPPVVLTHPPVTLPMTPAGEVTRHHRRVDGYRPTTYGDAFADVYDDWYADVSPPADTATFLRDRVDGLVVELGSGTGRLAGPIRAAGLPVVGIDASTAMLRRSTATHPDVPVVAADMAEPPVRDGVAGAVLVAFNTLFNLPTGLLQRTAMARAAAMLRPEGVLVVEAFVPGDGADERADHVDVVRLDADAVVLRISRSDPVSRTVSGHHVELRDGAPVRLRPWHLHYTDPAGVDALAAGAGLALVDRFGGWRGEAFDDASSVHVSVFGLAGDRG
jgi:SAM-dependent methyltransferase